MSVKRAVTRWEARRFFGVRCYSGPHGKSSKNTHCPNSNPQSDLGHYAAHQSLQFQKPGSPQSGHRHFSVSYLTAPLRPVQAVLRHRGAHCSRVGTASRASLRSARPRYLGAGLSDSFGMRVGRLPSLLAHATLKKKIPRITNLLPDARAPAGFVLRPCNRKCRYATSNVALNLANPNSTL